MRRYFVSVVKMGTVYNMVRDVVTLRRPHASFGAKLFAGIDLGLNVALTALDLGEFGGEAGAAFHEGEALAHEGEMGGHGGEAALHVEGCSFTSATLVTTDHGKQAIGTLHIGEKVLAYNPKTQKMEQEPILHVWIHTDNDLVDLTITTPLKAPHSSSVTLLHEVVHTNKKHPFFTLEKGFVPVGQITIGMHVLRADGRIGVITGWQIVPGVKLMYNLEVAQDHTFVVDVGQWVVHNCGVSRNLPLDEFLGGHTLSRHVNISEEDVFFRATVRGGDASAFYSQDAAAQAIQHVLDNEIYVMQGSSRVYEGAFTRNVGFVYDMNGNRFETRFLRIIERPSSLSRSGWFILTAYPIL